MSQYTVLRYMANESTEEFVNVAVIACDNDGAIYRVIENTARAEAFLGRPIDIEMINQVCKSLATPIYEAQGVAWTTPDSIRYRAQFDFQNVLRLRPLAGSIGTKEELLNWANDHFLCWKEED